MGPTLLFQCGILIVKEKSYLKSLAVTGIVLQQKHEMIIWNN